MTAAPRRLQSHAATLTCMDLFAGCGGLSLGLRQAGIDVRWANEIDPYAAATYREAHANVHVVEQDAEILVQRLQDRDTQLPSRGDVDVVVGGPPCQGFSGYNRHRHQGDARNSLVAVFLGAVDLIRPRWVLIENVPGLLSLGGGTTVRRVIAAFDELGYRTRLGILQAGHYGVPQNRWRVFIVAAAKGSHLPNFPEPTHAFPRTTIFGATAFRKHVVRPLTGEPNLFGALEETITVADAISDLPEIPNGGGEDEASHLGEPASEYQRLLRKGATMLFDHRCRKLGGTMLKRCMAVPRRPGAGWLDLPRSLRPANLLRHGDQRYDNRFGRLHDTGVFNTILTEPHPYWGRVIHPSQDRVISVRESARAQGFPDVIRFCGPLTETYRQVGNAVPPPLAYRLGLELLYAATR